MVASLCIQGILKNERTSSWRSDEAHISFSTILREEPKIMIYIDDEAMKL